MSRNKTQKFAINRESSNIIQEGKDLFLIIKGNWRKKYFENDNPIVLELGCGWGEYTLGLAENFPDKNFIGVDIKGDRIFKGSQIAQQKSLSNVAFLRTKVHDLADFFSEGEVDEIWITFPDPRPKKRDIKRRMTHPRFMKIYYSISKKGSLLHLKTDNARFFEYSLEVIRELPTEDLIETGDLYQSSFAGEHFGIQTKYEKIWSEKGSKIRYLRFKMI
jgi:tRNA (guanine-N7-)-methyltransferase